MTITQILPGYWGGSIGEPNGVLPQGKDLSSKHGADWGRTAVAET